MSSGSLVPICFACQHLRGVEPDVGWTCEAFGTKPIPTDILASVHDHHEPFDGDGGVVFKSKEGEDMAPKMATDPPKSESQRRAMFAAKAGHSTLGIPQSVGSEFASADPGGHLPEKVGKDLSPGKWGTLKRLFAEWMNEEATEPEHQDGEDEWSPEAREAAAQARKEKSSTSSSSYGRLSKTQAREKYGFSPEQLRKSPPEKKGWFSRDEEAAEPEHQDEDGEDAFEEGKHPRDPAGKFGSGSGRAQGRSPRQFEGTDPGLFSPRGHVSKAANTRFMKSADPTLGQHLKEAQQAHHESIQESSKENLLRNAKQLRDLAARGMSTKKYIKQAEALEKQAESLGEDDNWERKGRAASVAFTTSDGRVLLLRRSATDEHRPDEWCFPGGQADDEEEFEDCARREAREEVGDCTLDGLSELERARTPGDYEHVTYVVPVDAPFEPKLSNEHTDWSWSPVTDLPDQTHPGVHTAIDKVINSDESFEKVEHSLAHKKGVHDPNALAAWIGREHGKIPSDESEETKERHEGKLSERTREEIGTPGSEHREEMSESDFLEPEERKYPVKKEGKYDRGLLLAAARRARMQGKPELASRADKIREREFSAGGKDAAFDQAINWELASTHSVLAYDKSARTLDSDGRLHVDSANICQGKIDEYYGEEINGAQKDVPGWKMLDPKRKYRLFRDPKVLADPETVKSANGIPILSTHVATSASDHKFTETIGSTGTDARFEHPFIRNGLVFWPQRAIDKIDDGTKAQLSPGYRYDVDTTPGWFEGEPYDMRMTNIRFNHLASVPQGRQGSDVVVPDADPDWMGWAMIERAILDVGHA